MGGVGRTATRTQQLLLRGEYRTAQPLATAWHERWQQDLGHDHPDTLRSTGNLANILHMLGDYERASRLHQDTLNRRQRVLGDDHPDTLHSANNLALSEQQVDGSRSHDS